MPFLGALSMLSGGGGGGNYPPQQPIILTAPPPQMPQTGGFDMGEFSQMMADMMSQNDNNGNDQQDASLTSPTNVSPVLSSDQLPAQPVEPGGGLPIPDPTVPGTPEEEDQKKPKAQNGGMSVGLPT
jgi:hypothetical protein